MLRKMLTCALLTLGVFSLSAQASYLTDELVIEFEPNTVLVDKVATRTAFGVTNIDPIGPDMETWRGLTFPRTVVINGVTLVFNSVEEIVGYIDNNNGGSESNRANINHGDLQYIFTADPSPGTATSQTDPLPNCPTESSRIVGTPDLTSSNVTRIILFDQLVTATRHFENLQAGARIVQDNQGTHGNSTTSAAVHTMEAAGMDVLDYELVTYGVFFDDGTATYSNILKAFQQLELDGEQDAIINMSASAEFVNVENGRLILQSFVDPLLTQNNLLLVTSVGNDGLSTADVLPACADIANQISVAGSMNCFATPWTGTNSNDRMFTIAAEAEEVLTYDGTNYYLSDGTSFAAPLVTAVAAQVHSQMTTFDAALIKEQILFTADVVEPFVSVVKDGLVINATAATSTVSPLQQGPGSQTTVPAIGNAATDMEAIQIGPNPFSDYLQINGVSGVEQEFTLQLFNASGVLISQERRNLLESNTWNLSSELPAGSYFVRLIGDQGLQQQFHLIKQ